MNEKVLTMPKIVIIIEKTSSHIPKVDNDLLKYSKGIHFTNHSLKNF